MTVRPCGSGDDSGNSGAYEKTGITVRQWCREPDDDSGDSDDDPDSVIVVTVVVAMVEVGVGVVMWLVCNSHRQPPPPLSPRWL